MADLVSKKVRSDIMRAVKSHDSQIEVNFRRELWRAGIRYRKNVGNYVGRPDIAIRKFRIVIFIDSCFWHGCSKHCRMPSSKIEYWVNKIQANKKRDRRVKRYYKKEGWAIFRVWEHDLKNTEKTIQKIKDVIRGRHPTYA